LEHDVHGVFVRFFVWFIIVFVIIDVCSFVLFQIMIVTLVPQNEQVISVVIMHLCTCHILQGSYRRLSSSESLNLKLKISIFGKAQKW